MREALKAKRRPAALPVLARPSEGLARARGAPSWSIGQIVALRRLQVNLAQFESV